MRIAACAPSVHAQARRHSKLAHRSRTLNTHVRSCLYMACLLLVGCPLSREDEGADDEENSARLDESCNYGSSYCIDTQDVAKCEKDGSSTISPCETWEHCVEVGGDAACVTCGKRGQPCCGGDDCDEGHVCVDVSEGRRCQPTHEARGAGTGCGDDICEEDERCLQGAGGPTCLSKCGEEHESCCYIGPLSGHPSTSECSGTLCVSASR